MLDLDLEEGLFWEGELCEALPNFSMIMEETKKVEQRLYVFFQAGSISEVPRRPAFA